MTIFFALVIFAILVVLLVKLFPMWLRGGLVGIGFVCTLGIVSALYGDLIYFGTFVETSGVCFVIGVLIGYFVGKPNNKSKPHDPNKLSKYD